MEKEVELWRGLSKCHHMVFGKSYSRQRMTKKRKLVLFTVSAGILVATILVWFLFNESISNYRMKYNLNSIQAPEKGSRIIVFAPHNDDETLGIAEFISRAIKNGANVKVVLVTNGDGHKTAVKVDSFKISPKPSDYINLGRERQQETLNAMETLGVKKENVIFLGYPDRGVSHLWEYNWNTAFISPFTQRDMTPYTNSFTKDVKFTGENLAADMDKIIMDFRPDYIVYPHPNDRHPDHWAVNAFINYSLLKTGYTPKKELLYLVHRGDWPTPLKSDPKLYLVPPKKLLNTGTEWYAFDMDNNEIEQKKGAIEKYKSQLKTLRPLLTAFERKNELLGVYPPFKMNKSDRYDNSITPDDSNKIIVDSPKDSLKLMFSKGRDILGVYGEISSEGNLNVFIELDENIKDDTSYFLDMFLFGSNDTLRLVSGINEKKLLINNMSGRQISKDMGIRVKEKGRYLHFIIPKEVIEGYSNIFLYANTSMGDYKLDRTAGRVLNK